MCTANLLLFISVYMLFPVLPFVMGEPLGVSVRAGGQHVSGFCGGDVRWSVLSMPIWSMNINGNTCSCYSALIMLAAVLGYAFVDGYTKFLLLAAVQGACFRAGNHSGHYGGHRHNDFRAPQCRKHGICMGCTLGHAGGCYAGHMECIKMYGFRMVTYLSVAAGLASILFASRVYVAFRAPIGVSYVQYGPLLIAACMGSCHQYATDCFCTGSVAATDVCGRLSGHWRHWLYWCSLQSRS